jgi:hypothetical protein
MRFFKLEISSFFPLLEGTILACLIPDVDSQSGSADPIESESNSDPYLKHCTYPVMCDPLDQASRTEVSRHFLRFAMLARPGISLGHTKCDSF